jgi:hypothetical protein
MSDKLNKYFMSDPNWSMRNYPVDIRGDNDLGLDNVSTGVYDFDLELNVLEGSVELSVAGKKIELPVKAYWLPWEPAVKQFGGIAKVKSSTLDNSGANFLFTSALAGCRIVITEESFIHISGENNSKWRSEKTDNLRKGGRARAFSSTTGNKYGDIAFIIGYKDSNYNEWRFVAQAYETCNKDTNKYKISQVWAGNELYLI